MMYNTLTLLYTISKQSNHTKSLDTLLREVRERYWNIVRLSEINGGIRSIKEIWANGIEAVQEVLEFISSLKRDISIDNPYYSNQSHPLSRYKRLILSHAGIIPFNYTTLTLSKQ